MSESTRPDLDTLADYLEGLLPDAEAAEVQRWIADDPQTADLVRALEQLPSVLAAEPVEPMPADVVARVDAALEAESARQQRVAQVHVLPARRRRWLAPALVAAAAVGVVGIGAQVVQQGGSGMDSATSGADESGAGGAVSADRAESAEDGAALGGGSTEESEVPKMSTTGVTALTRRNFRADVTRAVTAPGGPEALFDAPATAAMPQRLTYSIVAADCAADLGPGRVAPVRLDGEPAVLVLRRVPGAPAQREAVAYPARCPEALTGEVPPSERTSLRALVRATIRLR